MYTCSAAVIFGVPLFLDTKYNTTFNISTIPAQHLFTIKSPYYLVGTLEGSWFAAICSVRIEHISV